METAMRYLFALFVALLLGQPVFAATEKRVALVIGNNSYSNSPLKNPVNDAKDIAAKLRKLGFEVIERNNLTTKQIGGTLREFRSKLAPGAVALVFYAGHGLQIKGVNYLPAVDADINSEEDVPNQSIAVNQIMDVLDESKSRLNLVFLDACRNNPYARSFRSADRGLARVNAPSGTLISYATKPGSVAADGDGRNGLYTSKLLAQMDSNQQIELALKRVVTDVKAASKGKQEPWMEGSIEGDFCFGGCTMNGEPVLLPTSPLSGVDSEIDSWSIVKESNDVEVLRDFLKEYPEGKYSKPARLKLKELENKAKKVLPPLSDQQISSVQPKHLEPPRQQVAMATRPQDKNALYYNGLDTFKSGDMPSARDQFTRFLGQNPQNDLAANTHYWIGETYYAEKNYESAILSYQEVIKKYLGTEKVSAAMLKQAMAFRDLTDIKSTKFVLKKLLEGFPKSEEAKIARGLLNSLTDPQTSPLPQNTGTSQNQSTSIELVTVPAGCFKTNGKNVCLDAFRIGKYEVTQGQYKSVMGSNPNFNSCGDNCPVQGVSWDLVQSFITRLNSQTGKNYRLPTEAEWEYACRFAGKKNQKYCGSNNIDTVAWYDKNSDGKIHPVGQKQANGLGIYDMSGNVYEMVSDWNSDDYPSSDNNPQGPTSGTHHVTRGGSFLSDMDSVQSSFRRNPKPNSGGKVKALRADTIGFRLAAPVQ
ncbi:MAG: tol-pal system protein YbgF [Deltaproteobacteria bacterium]